ncbi:chemotaxis protein CheX [Caproiciproducens sp. LBM24188]
MNDGIFIPFSKATGEAFKMMLNLEASTEEPEVRDVVPNTGSDLNIAIDVTGDLTGEVLYRFPKKTALEMVKIMCGMEFEEIDEFVTSAMGEIANIISGNAMTGLSEQNIICDIQPPKVLVGEYEMAQVLPVLCANVRTGVGDVELDVQLS